MNEAQQNLIDRLIFGEIRSTDPELARAMLQDPAFADEVRSIEKTLGAVQQELAEQANAPDGALAEAAPGEYFHDEFADVEATPEDVAATQALLAAVADPTEALESGGNKRQLVLKLCVPAAAIVLAWATLYKYNSKENLDTDGRPLLGTESTPIVLASNDFTQVILPENLEADSFEFELVTEDGRLLIQSGKQVERTWELSPTQRELLVGHDRVRVLVGVHSNQSSDWLDVPWQR